MGDLLSNISITPAGTGISVFFFALLAVLTFMLRRLESGNTEIRSGYSGLVGDMQKNSATNLGRALRAERRHSLEHGWRVRAEEYAYGLESLLKISHRTWTYEDGLDEQDSTQP